MTTNPEFIEPDADRLVRDPERLADLAECLPFGDSRCELLLERAGEPRGDGLLSEGPADLAFVCHDDKESDRSARTVSTWLTPAATAASVGRDDRRMSSAAYPASPDLADAVRRGQVERGLSNPEVARALGLGERTWARIKEGERGLQNVGEALTLARLFGWPDDAFDHIGSPALGGGPPGASAAVMAELKELRAEVGELRQLVVAAVGDRTIDPAAGSGGFLIEAVRRLLEQSNAAGASELPADVEEAATEVGRAVETTIAERRPSAPGRARPKGTGR